MGGWVDDFATWLAEQGKRQPTIQAYVQDLRRLGEWYAQQDEDFQPGLVTTVDLHAWRRYSLLVERVSPATWNRRLASVRAMARWALEMGYLAYDPTVGIAPVEEVPRGPRWLREHEARRLLRAAERAIHGAHRAKARWRALRNYALLALMLYTGLRVSEVVGLQWSDVVLRPRSGWVDVRVGKGGKHRRVPLPLPARRVLSEWRAIQERATERVFDLTSRQVQRIVARLGREAGLEVPVTPHVLRHTYARRVLDAGAQLTEVQKLLGHARLDTTAIYVAPSWEDLAKAAETAWG